MRRTLLVRNGEECRPQVQDQVVSLVIQGTRHSDAALDRDGGEPRFHEDALLVRGEHTAKVSAHPDELLSI